MRFVVLASAAAAIGLSGVPALSATQSVEISPVRLAQSDTAPARSAEETQAEETLDGYRAATARKLDDWSRKLEEYGDKAQAAGSEAGTEVSERLSEAWRDVQDGWERLTDASADAWEDSKVFLEDAWRDLESAWADAADEEPATQN